jgi:hypothetical protein
MSAASANREASRSDGEMCAYYVEAGDVIYAGTLTMLDTDGYLKSGADTASHVFAGVAAEKFNNAGQADGATDATDGKAKCRVWKRGVFEFAASSAAQNWVGFGVYIVDDQTVALVATTTNDILCGYVVEYVSSTKVRVRIDRAVQ